jgi:hypothetical protein
MKIAYLKDGVLQIIEGDKEPVFAVLDDYDRMYLKSVHYTETVYFNYPVDGRYDDDAI